MKVAVVNVPAFMAVVCGSAAGEFGHGPSLLWPACIWRAVPPRQDTRLLNNARKIRNRLVVDGRRLRRSRLPGDLWPVRIVSKPGAIPDQSAPGIGRQIVLGMGMAARVAHPETSLTVFLRWNHAARSSMCSILYIRTEPKPGFCVMFSAGQHWGTLC